MLRRERILSESLYLTINSLHKLQAGVGIFWVSRCGLSGPLGSPGYVSILRSSRYPYQLALLGVRKVYPGEKATPGTACLFLPRPNKINSDCCGLLSDKPVEQQPGPQAGTSDRCSHSHLADPRMQETRACSLDSLPSFALWRDSIPQDREWVKKFSLALP